MPIKEIEHEKSIGGNILNFILQGKTIIEWVKSFYDTIKKIQEDITKIEKEKNDSIYPVHTNYSVYYIPKNNSFVLKTETQLVGFKKSNLSGVRKKIKPTISKDVIVKINETEFNDYKLPSNFDNIAIRLYGTTLFSKPHA